MRQRRKLSADRIDITLPGIRRPLGAEHPVIKTMNEIVSVFRNLGYSVSEEGPEVETDYYNFEALNFPPNHPARDTQDTLFIAGQEAKAAARSAAAAHAHFARADSHHGADETAAAYRDSGQRCIATIRPTPATRRCFTRSKAWRWTRTSRSAI